MDRRFTPYQRKSAKKAPIKVAPPSHTPATWTSDEDEVLRRAVFKHGGKKWKTIATFFQQKTPNQCNQRWNELQNHGSAVKKPWCPSEDLRMIDLVKTHGPGKWAVIASYLPGRNGKQCRERWHNQLNPAIKKGPWTPEEDALIMEMQSKYGNRWAKITERLPGRTDNAVKNHWHSSMKAKVKRSSVSPSHVVANDSVVLETPKTPATEDQASDCADVSPPIAPSEVVQFKLEPGSLSPDSVAICPSRVEQVLCAENSVFLLDDIFTHDENLFISLPQPSECNATARCVSDSVGGEDDDSCTDGEDMEDVLDGLDDEELVLSTDPCCQGSTLSDAGLNQEELASETGRCCRVAVMDTYPGSPDSLGVEPDELALVDEPGFDESAFEPSRFNREPLPSLQLGEDEDLNAALEVLSDVSTEYLEPLEQDLVKTEPEPFDCPAPPSLLRSDWCASSLARAGLALPSASQAEFFDMETFGSALASPPPPPDASAMAPCPAPLSLPPMSLLSTDALELAWPSARVSTPPPLPRPDDVDDQRLVWDLM